MYSFFNTIAVAFTIALALYELYQFIAARFVMSRLSGQIYWNPVKMAVVVQESLGAVNAATRAEMAKRRYMHRSVLFHQVNASRCNEVPDFKSMPYFIWCTMVAVLFLALGLPAITSLGIGIAASLVTFVSKQGRDMVDFSSRVDALDDGMKNATMYINNQRLAARRRSC